MSETECKRVHSEVTRKCLLRQCGKKRTTADVAPWNQVCVKISTPESEAKTQCFLLLECNWSERVAIFPKGIPMIGQLACALKKEELQRHISLSVADWSLSVLSSEASLLHFYLKSVATWWLWLLSSLFSHAYLCVCVSAKDKRTVIQSCFSCIWSVWTQVHSSEHSEPAVTVNILSLIYMKTREAVYFLMFYTHIFCQDAFIKRGCTCVCFP